MGLAALLRWSARRTPSEPAARATLRAALAALLIAEPDFIAMDEPTNNLDADARAAVAEFLLERWRGGASWWSATTWSLLRRMWTASWSLTGLGAHIYGGGYDLYATRKAEEEAAAAREPGARRAGAGPHRARHPDGERGARRRATPPAAARAPGNDMPKIMLQDARAERAEQ